MKASKNPDPSLVELRKQYLTYPHGGPALNVIESGMISDGFRIVAQFKSRSSAYSQLRMAGFLPTVLGWFILDEFSVRERDARRAPDDHAGRR